MSRYRFFIEYKDDDKDIAELKRKLREIGLSDLAWEIEREHRNRRLLDSQKFIDDFHIKQFIDEQKTEQILSILYKHTSNSLDKAQSYNTAIMTVGYVTLIAGWQTFAPQFSLGWNQIIAAVIGFSVLLFVGWTLYNGFIIALINRKYHKEFQRVHESTEIALLSLQETEQKIAQDTAKIQTYYPFIFFMSAMCAFVAICIVAFLISDAKYCFTCIFSDAVNEFFPSGKKV